MTDLVEITVYTHIFISADAVAYIFVYLCPSLTWGPPAELRGHWMAAAYILERQMYQFTK